MLSPVRKTSAFIPRVACGLQHLLICNSALLVWDGGGAVAAKPCRGVHRITNRIISCLDWGVLFGIRLHEILYQHVQREAQKIRILGIQLYSVELSKTFVFFKRVE